MRNDAIHDSTNFSQFFVPPVEVNQVITIMFNLSAVPEIGLGTECELAIMFRIEYDLRYMHETPVL